jgi:hypothetical protein
MNVCDHARPAASGAAAGEDALQMSGKEDLLDNAGAVVLCARGIVRV